MIEARLSKLNKDEVLRYLGYSGQKLDMRLEDMIDDCIADVSSICSPRLIYKIISGYPDNEIISLEGNDIKTHLSGCSSIVLMAATAGFEVSEVIRKKAVTDMGAAAVLNSCANAAVENICDNFEADLRSELQKEGMYLTERFSPGYGDLPLSTQKELCAVLDTERKIGVKLTDSMLMLPEKSVTAIMGISKVSLHARHRDCRSCSAFETCSYRRRETNEKD